MILCTCWSSVSEGPGPWWGPAGRECVGVHESVRWRAGLKSPRSPVRGSNRSRWPRSRCGSDSGAYPPPRLWTLERDKKTFQFNGKCHILFIVKVYRAAAEKPLTFLEKNMSISSPGFHFFAISTLSELVVIQGHEHTLCWV